MKQAGMKALNGNSVNSDYKSSNKDVNTFLSKYCL